jgi:hypothetical protein
VENNDIFNRIFDKLDLYDERLNTTCNTITRIDQKLSDFIEAVNKRETEIKQKVENKYKNMTIVFGSITTVSILVGLSKTFGLI